MSIGNIINKATGAVDHRTIGSLFGATNPANLRGAITMQTAMNELMRINTNPAAGGFPGGGYGQNPYGAPSPYGQNPNMGPMGGQNPYGQNPNMGPMGGQNPYGQNPNMGPVGGQNPYGQNPNVGPVVGGAQNPYGQNPNMGPVVGGAQNPYGQNPNVGPVVGGAQNPYGQNPNVGPVVGGAQNPYGQNPNVGPMGGNPNPYGQNQNPYGQNQNPYGQNQNQNPYGQNQNQNPYGQNPNAGPVGGNQNPYGQNQNQNPYGQNQNQNPYGQNQNAGPSGGGQSNNMIRRNRVSNHGTKLVPGQKWSVAGPNGSIPSRIRLCIGWDVVDPRCEVDASAFMICQNEKVPGDEWFVFYGSDVSPDGSVKYQSNKENPALPDDAEFSIDLGRVRADIQKIPICATIYESMSQHLNFGMVKNVYARIVDESNNELCYIPMVDLPNEVTSLVFGELYRHNNQWKFCAVSAGYTRDLAQFCNIYGVELE